MTARATVVLSLLLAACSSTSPAAAPTPTGDPERWRTVEGEPFPFTTPIPPHSPTELDGTYTRNVEGGSPPIPCRRCAPYRLDRGDATLSLDAGRFRVEQPASRFVSSGHFLVDGDRVTFFNDANCPETRGVYRWSLSDGSLRLDVVDDDCAFDLLRARYLSAEPWESAAG